MKRWEPAQIKMRARDASHLLMILSSVSCLWARYHLWPRHACQLYAVDGDSGEEMLTSSCLTLLESQMRPRVIINIITIIVWSRGFGGWWSFRDLLNRCMYPVGGWGSSVLKPLNQGDSAESEQGFKYRAPPLTPGCLDPSSSPLLFLATLSFLFNVLFTSSSSNLSSFRCLLGCKFEFAVKSTRGSYDSTATTVVPLPVLFHSHPCSICYLHVSSWPLLHKCISKFRINLNNTRSWAWHDTLVKM